MAVKNRVYLWRKPEDRRQNLCPFSMLPLPVIDNTGKTITEDRRQYDRRENIFNQIRKQDA